MNGQFFLHCALYHLRLAGVSSLYKGREFSFHFFRHSEIEYLLGCNLRRKFDNNFGYILCLYKKRSEMLMSIRLVLERPLSSGISAHAD